MPETTTMPAVLTLEDAAHFDVSGKRHARRPYGRRQERVFEPKSRFARFP